MQITDQGSPNILWKEWERKGECERMRECRERVCACTLSFLFFFSWIAADMELAEEDGIVRIRRRDFTKRGLPMCNSFWRPWNCYCEKFSSCNSSSSSSTESPQIGRIQPPYNRPHHQHHHHHSHVSLKHDCMKAAGGVNGGAKVWGCFFSFFFFLQNLQLPKNIWAFVGRWMTHLTVWYLSMCAPNPVEVLKSRSNRITQKTCITTEVCCICPHRQVWSDKFSCVCYQD